MWPMGHAAIAYILYSVYHRLVADRLPAGAAVVLLAIGSQLPDLVDKPLAWNLGALPTGRSLAHSLLVLGPVCGLGYAIANRFRRPGLGLALGLGAISHTLVDAVPAVWSQVDVNFLLWPALAVEPYERGPPSVMAMLVESLGDPYFHLEFVLLAVAAVLWQWDGRPGLDTVRSLLVTGRNRAKDAAERP